MRDYDRVTKRTRKGGQTDGDVLATVELRLFKHPLWSPDAVAAGELSPGPVGGTEFTIERHDTFLSETQVLQEAIRHLLFDLAEAARRETRDQV